MKIIGFAVSMIISVVIYELLLSFSGIEGDPILALHVCAYTSIYVEICNMRKELREGRKKGE